MYIGNLQKNRGSKIYIKGLVIPKRMHIQPIYIHNTIRGSVYGMNGFKVEKYDSQ